MLAAFGLVLARAREGGAVTTSPTPAPEAEAGAAGLAAGAKNESGTCTPERETCVLASDIKDICHDVASDVVFQTTCDGAAPPLPQSGELNFSVAIFLSIMTFVVLLAALLLQVRVLLSGQAAAARANTLLIILAVAGGVLVLLKSVMDFYGGPDGNLFTAMINFLLEWTNGVADAREWSFLSEFVTEILVVATGLVTTNYAATKVGGQRKAANRRETSRENSAKDEQIEALELALAIKDTNARIDKGNVVDMKSLLERVRAAEAHATAAEARAAAAESISAGETAEAATQSEEASVAHLARVADAEARVADAEARAMAAEARRDAAEERAATAGVAETKAHAEAEAAQATVAGMEDQKARAEKAEAEAAAANMATVKAEAELKASERIIDLLKHELTKAQEHDTARDASMMAEFHSAVERLGDRIVRPASRTLLSPVPQAEDDAVAGGASKPPTPKKGDGRASGPVLFSSGFRLPGSGSRTPKASDADGSAPQC